MQKLILASSSKSRNALLHRLAIPFEICLPDIDETPLSKETASELVKRLSLAKARAGADKIQADWIIGSDQTAFVNGHLLGKPGNASVAKEQLLLCSGNTVAFHAGVCLYDVRTGDSDYAETATTVKFRHLEAIEIERYIEYEKPFDCAGSFRSESLGISLFEQVSSTDPTALLGLPLIKLSQMLRKAGFPLP